MKNQDEALNSYKNKKCEKGKEEEKYGKPEGNSKKYDGISFEAGRDSLQ